MKIHELKIEGFKSIGSITLKDPNPFSVFVGPNAAGKSNIFEALEFLSLCNKMSPNGAKNYLGLNNDDIFNRFMKNWVIKFNIDLFTLRPTISISAIHDNSVLIGLGLRDFGLYKVGESKDDNRSPIPYWNDINFKQFSNFTRIFVNNQSLIRQSGDDLRLVSDASNLEKVLKRILKDEKDKGEIIEILQLLIPGFSNIEIRTEELSGSDNLLIYEDALKKPLNKRLISDGTYNILAIIAAIYQSEEPQFLCIEEPENGLNPMVVKEMVSIFREKCREKGHYIWLNTHSQSLVAELTPEEIILVDKIEGNTRIKQMKGFNLHGLRMDDALFTNVLGGGIPW